MANVYLDKKSGFFYYRFTIKGKQYRGTTGKKTQKQAELIAKQRKTEIMGSGSYNDLFDRLVSSINELAPHQQEEVRRSLAQQLIASNDNQLLIENAFDAYLLKPKKGNPQAAHLSRNRSYWNHFTKWLSEKHPNIKYMNEITHHIADAYMSYKWSQKISERTFNAHLGFLRNIFDLLKLNAGLIDNVWKSVDKLKLKTTHKEALSAEQIKAILGIAEGSTRLLILIGLYTGMRLGDCCRLKWSEIDLNRLMITKQTAKTGKVITLPIAPIIDQELTTLPMHTEFVLPDIAALYPDNADKISRRIKAVFEEAGIQTTEQSTNGKRLVVKYGFHSLRHTFVSMLHENNVPQMAVMAMVGHNSQDVHRIYQHTSDGLKREAIQTLIRITDET
ncbi:MAG: tyrosine-type recombinase/integrase [Pontiellaceae bacterium]|tara:strand:- start:836 stop:2005 length:1170 start_codon:yes stop_codon:yes gene_type:complete